MIVFRASRLILGDGVGYGWRLERWGEVRRDKDKKKGRCANISPILESAKADTDTGKFVSTPLRGLLQGRP